ncbi:hypothetical protein [Sphingobacterium bovistauri]|uniref:Uncharacterized protein n=1 Tax=Sphingobacterium bovistauri TaxID=2781959 RepID=A0ABS7Z8M3_9SPHI|nr:hypothetical protein [Sphingobacterium bovistauri]MCA5005215.1 hypothetical protein [Sphingobacterium bovistauri]
MMMKMDRTTKILKIEKVVTYIEDYCCVVSFASDSSNNPESYLILTRQSSEMEGGKPLENFEWDLQIDYDGEITTLTSYVYENDDLTFIFDDGKFNLKLQLSKKVDLKPWLEFIFKEEV